MPENSTTHTQKEEIIPILENRVRLNTYHFMRLVPKLDKYSTKRKTTNQITLVHKHKINNILANPVA